MSSATIPGLAAYIDHLHNALDQTCTALATATDEAGRRMLEQIQRDTLTALSRARAGEYSWREPWGGRR